MGLDAIRVEKFLKTAGEFFSTPRPAIRSRLTGPLCQRGSENQSLSDRAAAAPFSERLRATTLLCVLENWRLILLRRIHQPLTRGERSATWTARIVRCRWEALAPD